METATKNWRTLHNEELRSVYSDTRKVTYIPESGKSRVEIACLQAGPPGIVVQSP
jgi:hypothetical protein